MEARAPPPLVELIQKVSIPGNPFPSRLEVTVGFPVPFTSALIQRGGSCPTLALVKFIQKVSGTP